MGLFKIGNELRINKLRRREYKYMEFYGHENERFKNKVGFNRAKEFFSNIGIENTINALFINNAEKKFNKILKEVCYKVNVLPREYSSLPRYENISMNGYYNFRYPEVSGNDDHTNKLLYFNEQQIIEDALNEARPKLKKLYRKYPQLEVKGKLFEANLWERLKIYDDARNGRAVDRHSLYDLEKQLGNDRAFRALASNNGLNVQKKRKLYEILKHAEKTMSATRNSKQMQEVNKVIEEIYMVLSNDNNVELGKPKDTRNQSFAERIIAFTKEKEQIQVKNAEKNTKTKNNNRNKNISSSPRERG